MSVKAKGSSTGKKRRVAFAKASVDLETRVERAENDDLLNFVTALQGLDEDAAGFSGAEDERSTEYSLASGAGASVDDFTAVLDDEDAGFANLKRKMSVLTGEDEERKVIEAPLALPQQDRIDRVLAYETTSRDISKWKHIIQKNRDAETLKFPLRDQDQVPGVTCHGLVASFKPETALEQEVATIIKDSGITPLKVTSDEAAERDEGGFDVLPFVPLDAEQVQRDLAKVRSSKFFAEIRSRRQAKIKSKKYRKMLAKERMKKEAQAIASGNLSELGRLGLLSVTADDDEARRERRMKAELDRARERLTLRTRKVNKWAQELLVRRHGDADGRLKILEQLKEKERLRQEIYGSGDKFGADEQDDFDEVEEDDEGDESVAAESDDELQDDDESDVNDQGDNAEVNGIFDAPSSAVTTGRHKFSPQDSNAAQVHGTVEDSEGSGTEDAYAEDKAFGADLDRSILRQKPVESGPRKRKGVLDANKSHWKLDSSSIEQQQQLIQEAFAGDDVFTDFAKEKAAITEAEAPKVEDVTLPGWGVWGGAGIALEDAKSKKARFVMHKNGLDPKARLDRNLKHVIINERRIKAAANSLTVPKVPFPFASAEEYSRHIAQPIGREWNTVQSYERRIQPRVQIKAGAIIKPIKFFKQAKHV
jgi:U3 small nucleolar RNA-associated protein 14